MGIKLVIVLVLYQQKLTECESYATLSECLSDPKVGLFIYDNSPQAHTDLLMQRDNVCYIHNKDNPGLAQAYNSGAEWLRACGGSLLLLLDQDTVIPMSFVQSLLALSHEELEGVGAVVPVVYSSGQQISPVFSQQYVSASRTFPEVGTTDQRVMAINSGTALTPAGLTALGAFNQQFPLDFLDHWIFWRLNQAHLKISVLPQRLKHDLSVLDYSRVSVQRYESIISAETLFYTVYDREKRELHIRHLRKRLLKQFLLVKNRAIWRRTWKEYRQLVRDER